MTRREEDRRHSAAFVEATARQFWQNDGLIQAGLKLSEEDFRRLAEAAVACEEQRCRNDAVIQAGGKLSQEDRRRMAEADANWDKECRRNEPVVQWFKEMCSAGMSSVAIQGYQTLYEETGNGHYVWRAYNVFRSLEPVSKLPDWIINYFDSVAPSLVFDPPSSPAAILSILRLNTTGGGPPAAKRAAALDLKFRAYEAVRGALVNGRGPLTGPNGIFAEVGRRYDRSETWVRDAYYEFSRKIGPRRYDGSPI